MCVSKVCTQWLSAAGGCCRWRAYFTSGSSALYLLAYSLFYFYTRLYIKRWVPMVMYFCYMTMISLSFFCLTGTIGFYGAPPPHSSFFLPRLSAHDASSKRPHDVSVAARPLCTWHCHILPGLAMPGWHDMSVQHCLACVQGSLPQGSVRKLILVCLCSLLPVCAENLLGSEDRLSSSQGGKAHSAVA